MKKKFGWIGFSILAAVALTGCFKDEDYTQTGNNPALQPGILIYNATFSQNEIALQPAGIALRLAVLLSEAEAQGKLDKLDQVVVSGAGNVKTLLFGANTRISLSGEVYEIAYAGSAGLEIYDSYSRIGRVRVDTGGKMLEETDVLTPWKVSLGDPKLEVTSGNRTFTLISTGDMMIYREDNKYRISFSNAASYITLSFVASWQGNFTWTPSQAADVSFSALKDKEYFVSGSGVGRSFWTLDEKSGVNLSYELKDGKYNPGVYASMHLLGGEETCRLTNSGDYNVIDFPSPVVKITWTMRDKRLYYAVDYNGTKQEFTY